MRFLISFLVTLALGSSALASNQLSTGFNSFARHVQTLQARHVAAYKKVALQAADSCFTLTPTCAGENQTCSTDLFLKQNNLISCNKGYGCHEKNAICQPLNAPGGACEIDEDCLALDENVKENLEKFYCVNKKCVYGSEIPPPGHCRIDGDMCEELTCFNGMPCIDGVCVGKGRGENCTELADCAHGLICTIWNGTAATCGDGFANGVKAWKPVGILPGDPAIYFSCQSNYFNPSNVCVSRPQFYAKDFGDSCDPRIDDGSIYFGSKYLSECKLGLWCNSGTSLCDYDVPQNTSCSANSYNATLTENDCPTPRMQANTQTCLCDSPTSSGAVCKNLIDPSCGADYAEMVVNGFNYYYPDNGKKDCVYDAAYLKYADSIGPGDWEGSKKYQDTSCQRAETQLCVMNAIFDTATAGYYPSKAPVCGNDFPPVYDLSQYCGNSASRLASNPIVILSAAMLALLSIKLW